MTRWRIAFLLKKTRDEFLQDSRVIREARSLNAAGFEVEVFLYGKRERVEKHHGIRTREVPLNFPRLPRRYNRFFSPGIRRRIPDKIIEKFFFLFLTWHYYRRTARMLKRQLVNGIHCHDFETLPIGYRCKKKDSRLRLVYDSHELWMKSQVFSSLPSRLVSRILTLWEGKMLRRADRVITVNSSIARYLSKKYRIEEPAVIANLPPTVKVDFRREYLRASLQIPPRQPVVLYQGALIPGRGIGNLIRAFRKVDPRIRLVLMGRGTVDRYRRLAGKYGLEDRLFFASPRPPGQLLSVTKDADLGVSLTRNTCLNHYYSSPNKMWEYVMARVPILVSDFPQMRDLAVNRGTGLVVDPEDPDEIAGKINWFFRPENRSRYREMKEACRRVSRKEGNWEHEEKKLLALYRDLFPDSAENPDDPLNKNREAK